MGVINTIFQILAWIIVILGIVLLFAAKAMRPFLRDGLKVIWKKKYLWFVGIFGGLAAYGGEVNFLVSKVYDVSSFHDYVVVIRDAVVKGDANNLITLLKRGFSNSPMVMIAYIVLALLLAAVVYWLIIISQGLIMRVVGRMAMGQPASFIDGISTASGKFWELLKAAIIFLLIGWGAWLIFAGLPTVIYFITNVNAWANIAQIGSYVSLVISFINLFILQYACSAIVLLDKKSVEAVIHAWQLFRRNTYVTIELGLVLFAANLLTLILLTALLTFFFTGTTPASFITTMVLLILELGVMSAFGFSVTTQLFVKLQKESPESKLGQWTERVVNLATAKKAA